MEGVGEVDVASFCESSTSSRWELVFDEVAGGMREVEGVGGVGLGGVDCLGCGGFAFDAGVCGCAGFAV